jgi:Helix-turn-helix domain
LKDTPKADDKMTNSLYGPRRERKKQELFSPREAEEMIGISHSKLYRLINAGRLDARKIDNKTVITVESIENFIAGLPKADCAA